jgi:hypothetical protein
MFHLTTLPLLGRPREHFSSGRGAANVFRQIRIVGLVLLALLRLLLRQLLCSDVLLFRKKTVWNSVSLPVLATLAFARFRLRSQAYPTHPPRRPTK